MKLKAIRRLTYVQWFASLLSVSLILTSAGPVWAGPICYPADLADAPLELYNASSNVPPILMIVMDINATMDYSIMTSENKANATNGFTYNGTEYTNVFINPTSTNATTVEGTAAVRNAWQTQCSYYSPGLTGYDTTELNKMYFDPTQTYSQWPGVPTTRPAGTTTTLQDLGGHNFTLSSANVNTPKWDPRDPADNQVSTATYQLYNASTTPRTPIPWGGTGVINQIGYLTSSSSPVIATANGASYTYSNSSITGNAWTQGTFNPLPPEDPGYPYYWWTSGTPTAGGYYTAIWTTNNLSTTANYVVYARWPAPCYANGPTYNIYNNDTSTSPLVTLSNFNQQTVTNSSWVMISRDSNNNPFPCTFQSGTAVVTLIKTITNKQAGIPVGCGTYTSGSHTYPDTPPAYAAQLKFVPINFYTLPREHFYMVGNSGNPWLVAIDNPSSAHFFKLVDANNNGIGDAGEYKALTTQNTTTDQITDYNAFIADMPSGVSSYIPAPGPDAYLTLMQNFANWFTYNRKRISAAVNAVATLITDSAFSNMLVGMVTTPPASQTGKIGDMWINTTFNGNYYDYTYKFLGALYDLPDCNSNSGYSAAIGKVGDFFAHNGGTISNTGDRAYFTAYVDTGGRTYTYPYFTENYGGSCQAAYCLVIADGANPSRSQTGNYDGPWEGCSAASDVRKKYNGGIFGDTLTKSAANSAMYYFGTDLMIGKLSNDVPTNDLDNNNAQHMVTFALSFGADGPLHQANPNFNAKCADTNDCNRCGNGCNCPGPNWNSENPGTNDTNSGYALDDLWHATVNSRGGFYNANKPQDLLPSLKQIFTEIQRRKGTAAAVTANSVQRTSTTAVYQGFYDSENWWGDLVAKSISVTTGAIGAPLWSAGDQLRDKDFDSRKVFTSDPGATYQTVGTPMDFAPRSGFSWSDGTALTADQVNYILGNHDNEQDQTGGIFRTRTYTVIDPNTHIEYTYHFKLGDISHSVPFYHNGVVYVGARDGMLHAFDSTTGDELFAYIPSMVRQNLSRLTLSNFDLPDGHRFYVDGSPSVYSFGTEPTYLACALGKGGKGVFCLKVDAAKSASISASQIYNWEYSPPSDNDLGYVYGGAHVVRTYANGGTTAVIFGNGYASANHNQAVLYVRNASDGSELKTFYTGTTTGCNGLSSPAVIDYNADGKVDYVYAGDLQGDLWKFDLTGSDPSNWSVAYGGHPLFVARDDSGHVQPIQAEPDAMPQCDIKLSGLIVVFGTGQYLNQSDLSSQDATQAIYGLYDWARDLTANSINPANYYFGAFQPGGELSNINTLNIPAGTPAKLLGQSVTATSGNFLVVSSNPINYYNPYLNSQTGQTHLGWYLPLNNNDLERVVRNPLILNGVAYIVSNTISSTFCSMTGGGYLYALSACNGGQTSTPQFDVDQNGVINALDTVTLSDNTTAIPSAQFFATTLFDPFALGNHLYIPDTTGVLHDIIIPNNAPGVRYWRIIE